MNKSLIAYLERKKSIKTATQFAKMAEIPLSTAKRLWYGPESLRIYPKTLIAIANGLSLPTYEIMWEGKLSVSFGTRNWKHQQGDDDFRFEAENVKEGRHMAFNMRQAMGYSIKYLAEKIGVKHWQLMQWERGKRDFATAVVKKLLLILAEHRPPTVAAMRKFVRERYGVYNKALAANEASRKILNIIKPNIKSLIPGYHWLCDYRIGSS